MSCTNVSVNISENQKHNLDRAIESKSPVSIRLGFENLCGNDILALANAQVNRMAKAYENGKGITIKMSKRQVVHNMNIEGGFLGMLAGLAAKALPFFAKTISQCWQLEHFEVLARLWHKKRQTRRWEMGCI